MNGTDNLVNAALALVLLVASMGMPALVAEQAGHASDHAVSAATVRAGEQRSVSNSATAPRP